MPLIKRATYDLLEMSSWCDILINPVNCRGKMGAGLALAYREKYPAMYEAYKEVCMAGQLQMDKIHRWYDDKENTTILNLPTKYHWADSSNLADIEITVQNLYRYLLKYPKHIVALPMLGAGLGKLDQKEVYVLFEKYLDKLPNIVFVCMRPDTFETYPKYLVIAGSRAYTDYFRIEIGTTIDAMANFGLSSKDFDAWVSGGARGVDSIACGTGLPNDNAMNLAKQHGVKAIVCHADWDRYGKNAGFVRNKTMLEIGTHFVMFIGKISVGTRMMRDLVERHNRNSDERLEEGVTSDFHEVDGVLQLVPTRTKKRLFVHNVLSLSN